MTTSAPELSYAIRIPVVAKHLGQLCLVLAALTVPPTLLSLATDGWDLGAPYVAVLAAYCATAAGLSRIRSSADVQPNEGLVLVASVFLLASLAMVWPLTAAGLEPIDALFEAVSGVTTTGLTTTASVEDMPASFLFTRAWMQWYGGLGIVALSVALVIRPGLSAKRLAVSEDGFEDLVGGARAHARQSLLVYTLLTSVGFVAVWVLSGKPFHSLLYTLSSVSTGGFAPHDASVGGFGQVPVQAAVLVLCLAGSMPVALYREMARRGGSSPLRGDLQGPAILVGAVVVALILATTMRLVGRMEWVGILHHAPVLAVSAQSTAGFTTIQPAELDSATKLALTAPMMVGGGMGSTAGGFKILRLLVLLRVGQVLLARTAMPRHAVLEPELAGRRIPSSEVREALSIILLYGLLVIGSWFVFVAAGYDPVDSLFEVTSATGTVGLSTGVTGPDLQDGLKILLCADMLMGRLEIVAWLVVLYPRTWMGLRRGSNA